MFIALRATDVRKPQHDFIENLLSLKTIQLRWVFKKLSSVGKEFVLNLFSDNISADTRTSRDLAKGLKRIIQRVRTKKFKITRKDDRMSPLFYKTRRCHEDRKEDRALMGSVSKRRVGTDVSVGTQRLKFVDKATIVEIVSDIHAGKTAHKNLAELLKERGYSTTLFDLHFVGESFRDLDLSGISFRQCQFDRCNFTNSVFKDVIFDASEVLGGLFINASFENVTFFSSILRESMFAFSSLKQMHFLHSDLLGCSFEEATIQDCHITDAIMRGSHFLQAQVKQTKIERCDLRDTIFFGTEKTFSIDPVSKRTMINETPISAFLCHPENRGVSAPKAFLKLERAVHTLPIRICFISPKMSTEQLSAEVDSELDAILSLPERQTSPAAMFVDRVSSSRAETFPLSKRILNKATLIGQHVDAILLPGGEDLPPKLYGSEEHPATSWGGDYQRSLLEMGLIRESQLRGIPLMAICRGFQMVNAYFGAQLIQHIEGHKNVVQTLSRLEERHHGLCREALEEPLKSAAFHHQAVGEDSQAKDVLEPVVVYEGLVKAVESRYSGAGPIIGLQVHPEFYGAKTAESLRREMQDFRYKSKMTQNNEIFWKIMHHAVDQYFLKQITLDELATHRPSGGKSEAVKAGL